MWRFLSEAQSVESIMRNKGLAKLGDNLVNLCYSLAKSQVLGEATGEKVKDRVLARAIRATPVYSKFGRRTDAGMAADAYEAIIAYLWLTEKTTIEVLVKSIVDNLGITAETSRKKESEIAAHAFQVLLEGLLHLLPERN
jgi:hypothetical protein